MMKLILSALVLTACSCAGDANSGKKGIDLTPDVCECQAGIYNCAGDLPVGCGCANLKQPQTQCRAIDKVNDVAAYCCPANTGPGGEALP